MLKRLALAATSILAATPALAHSGHGEDSGLQFITHNFTEADHLAGILGAAILAGVVIFAAFRRQRTSKTEVRARRTTS